MPVTPKSKSSKGKSTGSDKGKKAKSSKSSGDRARSPQWDMEPPYDYSALYFQAISQVSEDLTGDPKEDAAMVQKALWGLIEANRKFDRILNQANMGFIGSTSFMAKVVSWEVISRGNGEKLQLTYELLYDEPQGFGKDRKKAGDHKEIASDWYNKPEVRVLEAQLEAIEDELEDYPYCRIYKRQWMDAEGSKWADLVAVQHMPNFDPDADWSGEEESKKSKSKSKSGSSKKGGKAHREESDDDWD